MTSVLAYQDFQKSGAITGAAFRVVVHFSCPLLAQIAEELRDALPRIIGARHPLTQLCATNTIGRCRRIPFMLILPPST
jgi:hypothetical protein